MCEWSDREDTVSDDSGDQRPQSGELNFAFSSSYRIVRRFMPSPLIIDDFGGQIATVWSELRPATRGLVERALQAASTVTAPELNFHYDARADIELCRFLAALDDRVAEKTDALDP